MATEYQPKHVSHACQQTLPATRCTQRSSSVLQHPLSTVSSMASSTRSRFSSTVFFSTAPLHASDFEATQAHVLRSHDQHPCLLGQAQQMTCYRSASKTCQLASAPEQQ
jgi:hypothetical protein